MTSQSDDPDTTDPASVVRAPQAQPGEADLALARSFWRRDEVIEAEEAALRALAANPRLAEAELLVARVRWRSDDLAHAEEAARRALVLNPQLADAEMIVARARWRDDDPVEAEQAAMRALALNPQLAEAELILARVRLQNGYLGRAEQAALNALAINPQLAEAELIVARARWRDNDFVEAERAALRALGINPRLAEAELIVARACVQRRDPGGADRAASRALALNPNIVEAEIIVARARLQTGKPAEAEEAALRALALKPQLPNAAMIAAQAANQRGDVTATVTHYRRLAGLAPDDVRWPLKIVKLLDIGGQVGEARRELEAVRARWPSHRLVKHYLEQSSLVDDATEEMMRADPASEGQAGDAQAAAETDRPAGVAALGARFGWESADIQALFKESPGDAELRRPLVVDRSDSDVLIAECANAKTAVVVFTGAADRMVMPLTLFDRYLAALGVTAVYLKDFRRLLFVNGIQSFGDSYESTLAGLGQLKRRLKVERFCTLGNSGGARAAIRFGVELDADAIVGFATATGPAPCLRPSGRSDERIITARTLEHASADTLDLKPFLEQRDYKSRIALVYRSDERSETANALHLSDVRGISLHPVPGAKPPILSFARQAGFVGALAGLLGVPAPAARP